MSFTEAETEAYLQSILHANALLAPQDGTPFHDPADLAAFAAIDPDEHMPNDEARHKIGSLYRIVSIVGPHHVGKDGAKKTAIELASDELFLEEVHAEPLHSVRNGTTRLPEKRDGRVEDRTDYDFTFTREAQADLRRRLDAGEVIQFAQPRGKDDHVYFTDVHSFPHSGIAVMDTIPRSIWNINRVISGIAVREAVILYRTAPFELWRTRTIKRGDLVDQDGNPLPGQEENFVKRNQEAADSLYEVKDDPSVKFFEAAHLQEAGKAVIEAAMDRHPDDMQERAHGYALEMLDSLEAMGFVPKKKPKSI